jgi:hypothetical protein
MERVMSSATVSGFSDMEFVLGDDVQWTVTVKIDGTTQNLTGWTIRLSFTSQSDPTDTFDKTEADTDWVDNTDQASGQFDVLVDSTPTGINTSGDTYWVKAAIESGTTRHYFGTKQWKFNLPTGGAFADL